MTQRDDAKFIPTLSQIPHTIFRMRPDGVISCELPLFPGNIVPRLEEAPVEPKNSDRSWYETMTTCWVEEDMDSSTSRGDGERVMLVERGFPV